MSAALIARSSPECHLYIELHPCAQCGDTSVPARHHIAQGEDALLAIYEGPCPSCGQERRYEFQLDAELPPPGAFGGAARSAIIDPYQFLAAADMAARSVPGDLSALGPADRDRARRQMSRAVAAIEEVIKFIPEGSDRVADDCFAAESRDAVLAEPGRFRRRRLEAVLGVYRESLAELGGAAGGGSPSDGGDHPGLALIKHAMEVLNDPSADARIAAAEERKERRQELVLVGFDGRRDPGTVREVFLRSPSELAHYLRARKSKQSGDEVRFDLSVDGSGTPAVATWVDDNVELSVGDHARVVKTDENGLLSNRAIEAALAKLASSHDG